MKVRPIRTAEDYHMAMIKVQLLESTPQNKDTIDELEVLHILIEKYERDNAPMGMPDPIDSIKIYNQYFSDDKEE
ncbi:MULTISPECIES: hypothetical protein [unclassified Myroides]|uniref:hypothetical protein n=1 Tax=unclassified Myroides TaxID=2642485 RepID=UPI0015FDF72C|nr:MULTISPECIES: hypothetical protein [unclassified Myroides]MBB1149324.1 hypothetical protein [Myroides sp. NP-2]MDM1406771.1 hypothetical protein [Myroides sp. DF42-4-2]